MSLTTWRRFVLSMSYLLENNVRAALVALALIGGIFFSPWIPGVCIVLLAIRFRAWEALFIGLLMDLIWLPAGSPAAHLPLFTIGSLVLVWILEPVRSEFLLE